MKNLLENILEDKAYDDLGDWCMPNLARFAEGKTLFSYQQDALKKITKVLHEYYREDAGKRHLFALYTRHGLASAQFGIPIYAKKADKETGIVSKRFALFRNHYTPDGEGSEAYISGMHFVNRCALWMATGSGKSLVLIKTIELLDYLMARELIPRREIMLLLPREDLVRQFAREIAMFNNGRERKIEVVNLREYENDKQSFDFKNTIKVYCYRSDLLRDERKESILDYRSYLNDGKWYVLLDEAHRGETGNSHMQDYVSLLSKNGFLFNFSATFTDEIDYVTTCYNFNLEKFILAGYGKNIYLSPSYFAFTKERDDLSEREKQKQVLKSLITFAYVKMSRRAGAYHHPLLITLVNSINTDDADLLLFFKKLEDIASGKVSVTLFEEAKRGVVDDLRNHTGFVFGAETLEPDMDALSRLTVEDIFVQVFNATSHGKIEILEGEKGKEIVLKLQTSTRPFALIKIGDAGKFARERLGTQYTVLRAFDERRYFEKINESEYINILLGSRSFYEGWDSNRPNVINLINIGKQDAKKYVLQGIGRGIRIEPHKGARKRLPHRHKEKNPLLETLFVFATDKSAVKAIIETVEGERNNEEKHVTLYENTCKPFDLLIPVYAEENERGKVVPFNISAPSRDALVRFVASLDTPTLLLKTGVNREHLAYLTERIASEGMFSIVADCNYFDMDMLLRKLATHVAVRNKVVGGVKVVENELVHFRHIKVRDFTDEEVEGLQRKIDEVRSFTGVDKKEVARAFAQGKMTEREFQAQVNARGEETFKDLRIKHVAEHYYLPLVYSEKEKVEYITHVAHVASEVAFLKHLEAYIAGKTFDCAWMFSKVDEHLDKKLGMPYFTNDNFYKDFYPDFVFWVKKGSAYRIVFVDPKGGVGAISQKKLDGFRKLFEEKGVPKVFAYKGYSITVHLYFVGTYEGGEEYARYWLRPNDFRFLG